MPSSVKKMKTTFWRGSACTAATHAAAELRDLYMHAEDTQWSASGLCRSHARVITCKVTSAASRRLPTAAVQGFGADHAPDGHSPLDNERAALRAISEVRRCRHTIKFSGPGLQATVCLRFRTPAEQSRVQGGMWLTTHAAGCEQARGAPSCSAPDRHSAKQCWAPLRCIPLRRQAVKVMTDIEHLAAACTRRYGDSPGGGVADAGAANGGLERRGSLFSGASESGSLVRATSRSLTSRRSGHIPAHLQVRAAPRRHDVARVCRPD